MKARIAVWVCVIGIVVAGGAYWYVSRAGNNANKTICTMDAKQCPDGSYVGRTGPKCEFAPCPAGVSPVHTPINGILPYDSGVRGVVMLGPICPVQRMPPDPRCADKPYKTLVAVFHKTDPVHAFVLMKSDASGTFSFSLPPGEYVLGAGESAMPRCNHPDVSVRPGVFATTTVFCDTGIR